MTRELNLPLLGDQCPLLSQQFVLKQEQSSRWTFVDLTLVRIRYQSQTLVVQKYGRNNRSTIRQLLLPRAVQGQP